MTNFLMNLFEISINLFQGLCLSHYTYSVLGDKENRGFIKSGGLIPGIAIAAAITFLNFLIGFDGLLTVFYMGILFVYSLLRLNGNVWKKLFLSLFPVLFFCTISMVFANLYTVLFDKGIYDVEKDEPFARIASVIVCNFLIFCAYKITLRIFSCESKIDLNNYEWVLILSIFSINYIILHFISYVASIEIPYIARFLILLGALGLFAIDTVTVYLVVNLSKKNSAVRENQLLRVQQKYQQQYLENAENQYEKIKKMRHEFKNHNTVLASLLERGDIAKAKEYVNDYADQLTDFGVFVNTNNQVVNAVINCKAGLAESFNIKTSVVTVSEFTGIDDLDLCSLISNMFDNAIEACSKSANERKIIFSVSKEGSNYIFCMKNIIDNSILENNPDLVTTKSDKKIHGFGIKMLRDIAGKYNGFADFFEKDDFFVCYILLQQS